MKEINFRIIELPTHQVLLQKDFSNDEEQEENDLLLVVFYINGVKCQYSYGYEDTETRDKVFLSITNEQAQNTLDNALKMFE